MSSDALSEGREPGAGVQSPSRISLALHSGY